MVRYYCIDFETNGFPPKGSAMHHELPLPFSSMPIQVSVDIVDSSGVVEHVYDAIILGATRLCPWVVQNVPIPMSAVLNGKPLAKVIDELDALRLASPRGRHCGPQCRIRYGSCACENV